MRDYCSKNPSVNFIGMDYKFKRSFNLAKKLIKIASKSGADVVKFQMHIADSESSLEEPFRTKFSYVDQTRIEYWKRMEFNSDQWDELINHSKEREIDFICSVFSKESITMLENKNINAWKLGSGEVFNRELNNKLLKTNLPIIASSGMSNWDDIDKIVS